MVANFVVEQLLVLMAVLQIGVPQAVAEPWSKWWKWIKWISRSKLGLVFNEKIKKYFFNKVFFDSNK
jgi:hypothetical protein